VAVAVQSNPVSEVAAAKVANAPPKSRINVILFSGGSGTQTISEALLRHPQISLTVLINAYDDGLSTGRLRRFVPGMLGPSDVRKNITRIMPVRERSQTNLKRVSDYRLPVKISRARALEILQSIVNEESARLPDPLAGALPLLVSWQLRRLTSFLASFLAYFAEEEARGRTLDFTDCALGNLLFAGCYLEQGRDFNRAIEVFNEFHEVGPAVLINVTLGENLFLVAEKENGTVLRNEADIVAAQDASKIRELFLLDEDTYLNRVEHAPEPSGGWGPLIRAGHRVPRVNPRAAAALAAADLIIYGPGTQHSSLFPSYMTEGVAEAIIANSRADKIFLGNIHRDFDIQEDDANDLARKLLDSMSRKGQIAVDWRSVVTHFFVQGTDDNTLSRAKYVPFDRHRFAFPLETVKVGDWEAQEGRHSGGYVLDELRQIVQSRIDIELAQVHHMVSIVIPVLNEESTIEQVLRSVTALDFQASGMIKEVLVIDGGSTDHTVERARSVNNVKVFTLSGVSGRGAAMRLGVEKSRGNLILFFPGDGEYRAADLQTVVGAMVHSGFRVVFGTRAVKCTDLSDRLLRIYDNNRRLYLTSKYGGIMLSVATLLLYNRYVSDVLSSVKGYDAHLLRSLHLTSEGLDLETEIVAKLARRREYILELPVEYKPRTRAAGKKIRASDGFRALAALARFKTRDAAGRER
jgi:2-phospho-L-lactate transferase/gluconeogenesis factor (CofD/UPF0052 family)